MTFKDLNLNPEILANINEQGYTHPTPIQAKAIPHILEGRDILAGAETGTGKTAAFTLPLLQLLKEKPNSGRKPRALILSPTRELAAQIGDSIKLYGKNLHLKSTTIFGGVGINPQINSLRQGVDIVIATPGRLLDIHSQNAIDMSEVEYLVLDEADRMLDMGFIKPIQKIIQTLKKKRQTLFFSATYTRDIKHLADTLLKNPVSIEVARQNKTAETIDQYIYHVLKADKRNVLAEFINEGNWQQVLVFTKTKHGADKLTKYLQKSKITTAAIHGNKGQGARTRALADFKAGKVRVLVATDIAARGIDIDQLPYVINYELSFVPEDYVHRIGRTGRAGSTGKAISLVDPEEIHLLRAIERLIKKKLPQYRP